MAARETHLQMIQVVINPMGQNAFYLKGWTVTLVAAILAVAVNKSSYGMSLLGLVPLLLFGLLDAYALRFERAFRDLYNAAATHYAKLEAQDAAKLDAVRPDTARADAAKLEATKLDAAGGASERMPSTETGRVAVTDDRDSVSRHERSASDGQPSTAAERRMPDEHSSVETIPQGGQGPTRKGSGLDAPSTRDDAVLESSSQRPNPTHQTLEAPPELFSMNFRRYIKNSSVEKQPIRNALRAFWSVFRVAGSGSVAGFYLPIGIVVVLVAALGPSLAPLPVLPQLNRRSHGNITSPLVQSISEGMRPFHESTVGPRPETYSVRSTT